MSLSLQSIEILLDLIEIKVAYMQVQDRDDAKELLKLRLCRQELLKLFEEGKGSRKSRVAPSLVKQGVQGLSQKKKTLGQ